MLRFFLLVASAVVLAPGTCWALSSPSSTASSRPNPTAASTTTPKDNSFVVAQYNVLAGTLGANTHPWFLHGLPNLTDERREAVTTKFYRRDATTGKLLKIGWPDHAEGILTSEEQRIVEDVDRKYFAWDARKRRLLRTVKEANADIVSLVECDHYDTFWEKAMGELGYGGIYKQRARGGCSDGCAIFFRRNIFELIDNKGVELIDKKEGDGGLLRDDADKDDNRPISRIGEPADRVALLALLRHVPTGRRLMVVSTHLARNPEDPNKIKERARQVAQILYHVTMFAREHENEEEAEAPVVLAGDLNEANLWHLGTMARIKCGVADMSCHPFIFTSRAASAAASAAALSTPTSITSCRSMRIDYILLQPSLLEVRESIFEMGHELNCGELECRIIDQEDPIPNERHPSDHVPIAFRVAFRGRQSAAEGCAASWTEIVAEEETGTNSAEGLPPSPRPGSVLRLEEMDEAFSYFDGNGDGYCDRAEFSRCLERLGVDGTKSEAVLEALFPHDDDVDDDDDATRPPHLLNTDDFRALYAKSWLRRQRSFLDRVRSVRTMFDLSVNSTNFSFKDSGCLFEEMDHDDDGIVTMEDVIDHLARVERSEDSLRARVFDAFSFFEFNSGNDFSMQELHQCFVDACPFEVSTDMLHVAFADMGKASNERVELDEFIDWLIRIYFRKDLGWISLIGPIPK